MPRRSHDSYSRTRPTRSRKVNSGSQERSITLVGAILQGALADACHMIHMGWTMTPVVNSILLDFPTLHVDQARAIFQYASEACAAASLINLLPLDQAHLPGDLPHVRE